MIKKSLSIGVTSVLSIALLAGCGSKPPANSPAAQPQQSSNQTTPAPAAGSGDAIVIKFAGANPDSHPSARAIVEKFKPLVEEKSGGKIKVEVFNNAQLGGERDVLEQLQLGQIEMSFLSPVLGNVEPKINALDLPYLFKDYEHLDSILDGELGKEILKDLPEKGLRGFAYMENGFRQITNSVKPINSIDDLKGLKIRVPEAPLSIANLEALGANVVTVAFPEVYPALQQGTVDGQENAYPTITSSKFYEVQKYVAETNHMWGAHVILASEKWFSGLSPEFQKIIEEAANETSKYNRQIFREGQEKDKQALIDKGMTLTTPDLEPFRKAVEPVYEKFFKDNPDLEDLVNRIRNN